MVAPLIIDTNQRLRSAKPNKHGMSPWAAERLQGFGIDPYDQAQRIAVYGGDRTAPPMPPRRGNAPATALAIDYNDVTQRRILDQAAAEVMEDEDGSMFVADVLAPVVPVDDDKGSFPVDDYNNTIEQVDDQISTHGEVNEVQFNHTLVPYTTRPRGLMTGTNRALADVAPMLVSVSNNTRKLSTKVSRQHEVRVATLLGTATNFHATCRRVLGAGQNWNGGASADPIADMQAMIAAMIAMPNTSAFSLDAWQAVQVNNVLREILASQLNNAGMLRPADWSLYWGVLRTVISTLRTKTLTGATATRVYPTTSFALLHVNGAPKARCFAKNVLRGGKKQTTAWFEPRPGTIGKDMVKVAYDNDLIVLDDKMGAICTGMRA